MATDKEIEDLKKAIKYLEFKINKLSITSI